MKENPNDWSPVLDRINGQLTGAAILLNGAAENIVHSELDSSNVLRIAEALKQISYVQDELYELEPEFVPVFLRNTKRWKPHFDKRQ